MGRFTVRPHKPYSPMFSSAEKRIESPARKAPLSTVAVAEERLAPRRWEAGRTRRSLRRNTREACRVSPRCQFGVIDGGSVVRYDLSVETTLILADGRNGAARATRGRTERRGKRPLTGTFVLTSSLPLPIHPTRPASSINSKRGSQRETQHSQEQDEEGGVGDQPRPMLPRSIHLSSRSIASPARARRGGELVRSSSRMRSRQPRHRDLASWLHRRARAAPALLLAPAGALLGGSAPVERHSCEARNSICLRGICSPICGHRRLHAMKPITTLVTSSRRPALVGAAGQKVADSSISVDEFAVARAAPAKRAPAGEARREVGCGRRRASGRSVGFGGGAKIQDNKVARSAGGQGSEGLRGWGIAVGCMALERLIQVSGGGRFLDEKLMAMGLGTSGWSAAWAWAERKEWRSRGSTTADNSLANSVNGKCCGECQCVTMNHGTTNHAVARLGGGL
jgi:hypothetical protein